MHLLERETHLASLTQYADDAREGSGRLVLIAGEAGVGKSSLLEQLEDDLPAARWAWGACDGLFTPRPLAPLLDVVGIARPRFRQRAVVLGGRSGHRRYFALRWPRQA